MITARNEGLLPLAAVLLLAGLPASCASPPARFYTLESVATASDGPAASYAVIVGPVMIPASVDRPELVVQVSANEVELLEFDRWASPLGEAIARSVAGDLAVLLGTPRVASGQLANFAADYRVSLDVQRFAAKTGSGVDIDTVWVVKRTSAGDARSGRTSARELARGTGNDALAAAFSRALGVLAEDVAAAIRAEAARKP